MGFGSIGWFANLFLPAAWALLLLSGLPSTLKVLPAERRGFLIAGPCVTVVGAGVALCSMSIKVVVTEETTAVVTSMGAGFYAWLGSFGACFMGNVGTLWLNLLRRESAQA